MHEITEPGPGAFAHLVLATTRLPEVSDWRQFGIHWPAPEPTIIEILGRLLCVLLPPEFDVNIADQVIAEVVAHVHLLDFAVLVLALDEHVLEEVVVVLLHLLVRYVGNEMRAVGRLGRILRIHVQILQEDRLRERWLVVDA